ncbi:MAG: putative toxin-antitoxin system toxin component, PIN family [Phycisphaeraceae bacterium]
MTAPQAAVFDCNIFLRAMLTPTGPSAACCDKAANGDVILHVAPFVFEELRDLPNRKKLRRFPHFTHERVERFIEEVLEFADLVVDPPPRFSYPRDPDDTPYIDLAIATGALLVVSNDTDLLDLMCDSNAEGSELRRMHPSFHVYTPPQFLALFKTENKPDDEH